MNVLVIGAGAGGASLCIPLLDRGHAVTLVGTYRDEATIEALLTGEPHPGLGAALPAGVRAHAYAELRPALQADLDLVVVAVRAAGLPWVDEQLGAACPAGMPILVLGGGLIADGSAVLAAADWLARALESRGATVGGLGGPWRPDDLLNRRDALGLLTLPGSIRGRRLEGALATAAFQLRFVPDPVGVAAALALARLFAIGIGAAAGRDGGPEGSPGAPLAMVFTQAVQEMRLLLRLIGGDPETAAGPAGVGQLVTLLRSSAEHDFGQRLASGSNRGESRPPEGVEIAQSIGPTVVGWGATGRLDRRAVPLTRALLDALVDEQPLVLPFSRFHRPPADRP
jgi:glycerol-3-phosphate dehydrogenase